MSCLPRCNRLVHQIPWLIMTDSWFLYIYIYYSTIHIFSSPLFKGALMSFRLDDHQIPIVVGWNQATSAISDTMNFAREINNVFILLRWLCWFILLFYILLKNPLCPIVAFEIACFSLAEASHFHLVALTPAQNLAAFEPLDAPTLWGTMGLVETHSAGIGAPSWWWCTKRLTWQPWTSSTVIPTALCAACRALAHRVGGCAGYRAYRVGSGGEVNKGWGLWMFWIYLDMFTKFRCLVALKEEWNGMSIGCIPQIFPQDKFFVFAWYS